MRYNQFAKHLKEQIEKYDTIAIFRHEFPDYDALGSQFGLKQFINDNYPDKKVYALGANHQNFSGKIFPYCDEVSDIPTPFLAIVVDTANSARIDDKRYQLADYIIKIDHHPAVEDYGNKQFVDSSTVSASQILAKLFSKWKNVTISKDTQRYLYIALVGDSGRFLYSSTNAETFQTVAKLLKGDELDLPKDVYIPMYTKTLADLKIQSYILANFKVTPHGVAYYFLDSQVQKELNITPQRGKENINLFSNIDEVQIWVSFSQDEDQDLWRVSIRSRFITINEIAGQFGGGGHKNASGATVHSLEEAQLLLDALDKAIGES